MLNAFIRLLRSILFRHNRHRPNMDTGKQSLLHQDGEYSGIIAYQITAALD